MRELESLDHQIDVIHPGQFKTRPCPGYAGIELAVRSGKSLSQKLDGLAPDAIHIATEGPLGWGARAYCIKKKNKIYDGISYQISGNFACGIERSARMELRFTPSFP